MLISLNINFMNYEKWKDTFQSAVFTVSEIYFYYTVTILKGDVGRDMSLVHKKGGGRTEGWG